MKRIIAILLLSGIFYVGTSCSVQDEAIDTEANAKSIQEGEKIFNDKGGFSKGSAEGLAEGLKNIKIDFVTLFKYNNESELKSESERIFKLALNDMPYEMNLFNRNATYMLLTVDVTDGKGEVKGMSFLNERKDVALSQLIPNAERGYDTVQNVPFESQNTAGYTLVKDGVDSGDAMILSDYLLSMAKAGKTGSFIMVSSADKASLYLKS